ncbi:glycosyltransferase [Oleiharenicola lentus]|uniref:glycosyltransferase n=1 Tax=Oleiharenicola lentus TaxID=2508720 RepID=UPI003F6812D2
MNRNKKILILTSAHLCRNPRVVKEATTLGAAGYDVTVMSISVQDRFEKIDLELMRGLPFKRVVIDYAANTVTARITDFMQRSATWLARKMCSELEIETAQTLGPAHALLRFARTFPADLTIVHTEIPIWAAQHLIKDGRKVAVDVEDWYSEDLLYADRQSRPIQLLRHAEEFALRHSVYASTTAQSMADELAKRYRCPTPIVLRNTFPLQKNPRTESAQETPVPSFIWCSQTIGPGRGLELFFAAWARTTKPSQVFLVGDEKPGYRAKLMSRLPESRRADLKFIPLVTPEELPRKLAEFDIGLALEPRWPLNKDITISNKILQYMNAGLAIIASETAGQMEVVNAAPGCGFIVSSHETTEYAAKLDELIGDRARLRAMQAVSRAAAENIFCWEHEVPRLLAAVEKALAN